MLQRAAKYLGCLAGLLTLASATWADPIELWSPRYSIIKCQFGAAIDGVNTQLQSWDYNALASNGGTRTIESITGIKRGNNGNHVTPTTTLGPYSAVKVSAGDPQFTFNFGNLPIGCYAIRIIAAIKTTDLVKNTTDANYPDNFFANRKPMYIDFYVTDKLDGTESYYRQRVPTWDSFYCVTELYFNVDDQPGTRAYTGRLKVGAGSLAPLYIRSIELHNVLAGLPGTTVKTGPSSFTIGERAQLRTLKTMAQVRTDVSAQVAIDDGYLNTDVAPYAEGSASRIARDDMLWNALLPINTQYIQEYDESFVATTNQHAIKPGTQTLLSNAEVTSQYGTWDFPYYWTRGWYSGFKIRNSLQTALLYQRSDLEQHRALNQIYTSYPYADDGTLLFFPYDPTVTDTSGAAMTVPAFWGELGYRLGLYWESVQTTLACYHGTDNWHHLPWLYHAGPDATQRDKSARDAALLLCKFAYLYPAITDAQVLGFVVQAPGSSVNLEERLLYRYFLYQRGYNMMQGLLQSYDYLFDYIDDPVKGAALAAAVHRYIPWVNTKEDVKRLIETRLVQFASRNIRLFQLMNDSQSPEFLALVSMIQQSNNSAASAVTTPWMSQLWSKEWIYGYAMAGTPDYVSTATQRDGTSTIGSVFYSQGGSSFGTLADYTNRYVAAGGDSRYNLTDFGRYRKLQDANLFPVDSTIAGAFPMTIGDVGAPDKPRMINILSTFDDNFRRAWSWGQDPRAAWILKNYLGRLYEDDATWSAIGTAATTYGRNPFLALGSRVMADWAGILETGQSSNDYRFKRTAYLRVGYGSGHSHGDTLDLQVQAHGVSVVNDLGYRTSYGGPKPGATILHNRIEVDGNIHPDNATWNGPSWVGTFKPADGAQYEFATASPPYSNVYAYTRAIASIDVDDGSPVGGKPPSGVYDGGATPLPTGVTTPNGYVFDVQRVNGGLWPTFCFHGNYSEDFAVNLSNTAPVAIGTVGTPTDDQNYLRKFMDNLGPNGEVLPDGKTIKYAGDAPGGTPGVPLVATWMLRRSTSNVYGYEPYSRVLYTLPQRNAEATMLAADYSASAPRKFTRMYLFGHGGDRGMVGYFTPLVGTINDSWPFLMVQNRNLDPNNATAKQVYTSVIEPFCGSGTAASPSGGFISSTNFLTITNNASDHLKAVAVQVTTTNGHTDLNFSDGTATTSRGVAGGTIAGKFAYVSKDSGGGGAPGSNLRLAHLVEGSQVSLSDPVLSLTTASNKTSYLTAVTKVDYYNRKVWLSAAAFADPTLLVGEQVEITNAYGHNTSYPIVAAALDPQDTTKTILTLDKALDLSYAEVNNVISGTPSKIYVRLLPLINWTGAMGGWTLTNDTMTKSWNVSYTGTGSDSGGTYYIYQVNTGGSAALSDFPVDTDGRRVARVWTVGVGDTLKLPIHAYLKRDDSQSDATQTVWKLKANVGLTLGAAPGASPTTYSYRWNGQANWQSLTTSQVGAYQVTTLSLANLVNGAGSLYLRAQANSPLTVTLNQAAGQADPAKAAPINFTVVFSRPVSDFASGDVTRSGSAGASTASVTQISPLDGTTYNVAVSGMSGPGTVIATLAAGVAHDSAGVANQASTSSDNTVTLAPVPGDVNLDGQVDLNDFNILAVNYGQSGKTWAQGDCTGDGRVDINDFNLMAANWPSGVAGSQVVASNSVSASPLTSVETATPALGSEARARRGASSVPRYPATQPVREGADHGHGAAGGKPGRLD